MKPRTYQYLQLKDRSRGNGGTRIKIWPCKYLGCKRILNDVDNSLTTKYCKYHKEVRVKEKNRSCYVKRNGVKVKDYEKNQLLIYLLRNNTTVSKYQILAYTHIKNMDSLRSQLTFLRRKGHKIKRKKEFYSLEEK